MRLLARHRKGVVLGAGVVALLAAGLLLGRSLRLELAVDGASFARGESVGFSLTVCSNSMLPMSTDDGRPSWRIKNDADEIVADSSHQVFTLELKRLSWWPRSCREVDVVEWDQREWNQPSARESFDDVDVLGDPVRGELVSPGAYRLEAGWGSLSPRTAHFEIAE